MTFGCKKMISIICSLNVIAIVNSEFIIIEEEQQTTNGLYAIPSLKFVAIMVHHGNKAPEFSYKTDPYKNSFSEENGQLTLAGKKNMYIKGQKFRQQYNGFLSEFYLESEIFPQTTKNERTYMSLAMIMTGMYPPKEYQRWLDTETVWQPFSIYHNSPDHGLISSQTGLCPSYDVLSKDYFIQYYNIKDDKINALLSFLTEMCKTSITKKNLLKLYDLFLCQQSANLPLPDWMEKTKLQEIKSIVYDYNMLRNFFINRKLTKLVIGPMMNEIALTMKSYADNTSRKMHIYSGNDISMGFALEFLSIFSEMPKFGASLHLHLYLDEKLGYIIKLFYYEAWDIDEGNELPLYMCGVPCILKNFIKTMELIFVKDWIEECTNIN